MIIRICGTACNRVAPSLVSSSPYRAQALSLARCTSAVIIGIARMVCAITIAVGVKSRAREPSGPERESARYRARPTTTGGNPKKALIKTTISRRPRKGKVASAAPMGRLTAVAVAAKLTLIESPTISRKSLTQQPIQQKGNFNVGQETASAQLGACRSTCRLLARTSDVRLESAFGGRAEVGFRGPEGR
jgi:hypothetical protein